jgi:Zn-dependent M28 family amino/carboxypeptidase
MSRVIAASLALALLFSAPALAKPDPVATAAALRDKALTDSTAWDFVEGVTTEVGPRLAGTVQAERGKDWGLAKLKALGFENVHAEPFTMTAWVRGEEAAEVTAPFPQKLMILGLGGTVATPPGGIEAEIALFHSYADLLAAPAGSLTGKIAVVTQPMVRSQDGSGYGWGNSSRTHGPAEAAKRGAIAFLTRSISTSDSRLPHTGKTNYEDGVPKIPAAALGVPDAELLDHMALRGRPIRIRLMLQSREIPGAPAWNVVGELRGSEKPDEIVAIGGHMDSWDPGQGAIDDGAGMAIAVGAAHLIGELPRHPRRTIRVTLFGAEEMDFSDAAYGAAHKAEAAQYVVTGESDTGSGPVWRLQLPAGGLAAPAMKAVPSLMAPLKVVISTDPARFSGSDFGQMQAAGVPAFSLMPDTTRYFDIHHSADDTLNKVNRQDLDQSVAAWAALVYLIADSDVDFRAPAPRAP